MLLFSTLWNITVEGFVNQLIKNSGLTTQAQISDQLICPLLADKLSA